VSTNTLSLRVRPSAEKRGARRGTRTPTPYTRNQRVDTEVWCVREVGVERDQRRSEVLRHDDVERVGDGDVVAKGPGLREQRTNLNAVGRRGEEPRGAVDARSSVTWLASWSRRIVAAVST
jgi:hypothetical protein